MSSCLIVLFLSETKHFSPDFLIRCKISWMQPSHFTFTEWHITKTLTYMPSVLFEPLRYVSCFFFKYLQLRHLPCCAQPVLLYGCAVWEVVNTVIPNPDEGRGAGCSQPWSLRGILRDQSWATITWPAALTPNTCGKEQNSLAAHSG